MSKGKKTKIMIDPGHGGDDPGAVYNGFKEKDFVLDVSFYQLDRVHELGYEAVMTRYGDETLKPNERIERINSFNPDYILSNHINAGGGEGAEIIHSVTQDGKLANLILNKISNKGQKTRRIFYRKREQDNRDVFFIHRQTKGRALIIEYGFIDNGNDRKRLKTNLRVYGEAVIEGLNEFINLKK